MKRLILFSNIILLLLLTACSEDLDYRKACAEKDWPKAYSIVEKYHGIVVDKNEIWRKKQADYGTKSRKQQIAYDNLIFAQNDYQEAYRYVVLQEAMSELEQGNLMRIAAIVKEQQASWVYKELIQIAESIGDKELAQKLNDMAQSLNKRQTEEAEDNMNAEIP